MKRAFFILLLCLAPWMAPGVSRADAFAECADRIEADPDCVLAIADAWAARFHYPDLKRAQAVEMLVEAGRIAAALRLAALIGSETAHYEVDEQILSFYVRERRLIEAQAYLAALPEDPPKWAKHKTRRTSNTRRNFAWIRAQDAPEADVLETLDWVAGNAIPEDRVRIAASLIPSLARQGHLDRAYDELHAFMASDRGKRGWRRTTRILRFQGGIEPSPRERAADLVWVSVLLGRRDIADRLDEEFRGDRSWKFALPRNLGDWVVLPDRIPTSAGPSAAMDIIDFAQRFPGDEPYYGERIPNWAHYIATGILIRQGEYEKALGIEIQDRALRAKMVRDAATALADAGRLQEASDIIDANRAMLDDELGGREIAGILREIALKQNDFVRAAQGLELYDNEAVRDDIRARLFSGILDREGLQSPNLDLAFDLFHAIEDRDRQFTLLATRAAAMSFEDRAILLDRAGVDSGQHIRLRPIIEIYAAANAGEWDTIQPLVDGLTRLDRPRLDEDQIARQALAAGEVELAFEYAGTPRKFSLGPDLGSDPRDQAVLSLALNGEHGRALRLTPQLRRHVGVAIAYAIWALLKEDMAD